MNTSNNPKYWKYTIFLLIILIIILTAWVYFVTNYSWIELADDNNEIGDAVGGITNPIIGIGGIILTFIAFYVQYQFNKDQTARIDKEATERIADKLKSEKESNFKFLLNEYLRVELKITYLNFLNIGISNKNFINELSEINFSFTLLNNLIYQIDLDRVIGTLYENVFLDKNDRILLSNIRALYTSKIENYLIPINELIERINSQGGIYGYGDSSTKRCIELIAELSHNMSKINAILVQVKNY